MAEIPSNQKALLLEKKFGDFVVRDFPRPGLPGVGEVLVKVIAVGLNPIDWKVQQYSPYIEDYPTILGVDVAGDVEEIGEGVERVVKGDRVFFQAPYRNGYAGFQQYTKASASTLAKIPAGFSHDDAATIPLALATGYVGLYHISPFGMAFEPPPSPWNRGKYGDTAMVVIGGSSSVGQLTIQLAKLSGFNPIIATSSLKHTDFLKSLGATHVLDRYLPLSTLPSDIANITDKPILAVYDAISSAETQKAGLDLLAVGGQVAVVLRPSVESADKKVIWVRAIKDLPHNVQFLEKLYTMLTELMEEGLIKPNRLEILPGGLSAVDEGLTRMRNDQVSGVKLVVHPQETD